MKHLYYYNTPIGKIGLAEEHGLLTDLCFINMKAPLSAKVIETDILKETYIQLCEFLEGKRKSFDIPINPAGDKIHQKVLIDVLKIPYGMTVTYKDLSIVNNLHPRAIGAIVGKNPIPIIIPCHRVIGSNGNLTGYIGGLELKQKLLDMEAQVWSR